MDAYAEALSRLYALTRFGEKLDLSTPQALNAALGDSVSASRAVLIAGTNGKGSTSAMTEALVRRAGLRTGLFTSPHLVSFRERIAVDGEPISEAEVVEGVEAVLAAAEHADLKPSFFEATWALAAWTFARRGVELAIWEVGLGGRLDATNVCEPEASAVTSIGLDHTHILGDTVEAIAREKAGVFRPGRPALTAVDGPALEALRAVRAQTRDTLQVITDADTAHLPSLSLPGAWQRRNAALALALVGAIGLEPDAAALSEVRWPGRLERLPAPHADVLLDCAHNPPAAEALAAWIRAEGLAPVHLIFGAMAGKDYEAVLTPLLTVAEAVDLVTPSYPRRIEAETLAALPAAQAHNARIGPDSGSVSAAIEARASRKPAEQLTVIAGSSFLVGEARAWLMGQAWPERGLSTTAR